MTKTALFFALVLSLSGCMADKSVGVMGLVVTKPDLARTYLRAGIHPDVDYTRIEGASIYLAFDAMGEEPIIGFDTRSDAEGNYRIETKGIPPAKRADGDYYLVVEKEGYERIVEKLGIGPLNPHIKNTAVLKPISEP